MIYIKKTCCPPQSIPSKVDCLTSILIFWILFFLIVSISGALFCCAPKQMTLDEAKQTAISMRGKSFVPPPRGIDDILCVIYGEAKSNASDFEKWKNQSKIEIDKKATRDELIELYLNRGNAEFNIGLFEQSRDDFQNAYLLVGSKNASEVLIKRWAYSEMNIQNYDKAIELFSSLLGKRSVHYHPYAELANIYALTGEFDKAEAMINKGRLFTGRPIPSPEEVFMKSKLEYTALNMKAKYEEAEPFIRTMLNAAIFAKHNRYVNQNKRIALVKNLSDQNRLVDAEMEARKIIDKSIRNYGTESAYTTDAVTVLSEVLLSQGRLTDAERVCYATLQALEELSIPSISVYYSQAISTLCKILIAKGDYFGALEQYSLFLGMKKSNRYIYERYYRRSCNVMLALILADRSSEAMELIESALQSSEKLLGERHSLSAELLGLGEWRIMLLKI
jgi:tetratricopeptide (TPR) repeat protein